MARLENKCEAFNILVMTERGHPALNKFVQSGGIPPLYQMCVEIRDNQKVHTGNLECFKNDLQLFKKLVSAVKNLPSSSRVLTETKIGRGINSIVKDGVFKDEEVSQVALDLVN